MNVLSSTAGGAAVVPVRENSLGETAHLDLRLIKEVNSRRVVWREPDTLALLSEKDDDMMVLQ